MNKKLLAVVAGLTLAGQAHGGWEQIYMLPYRLLNPASGWGAKGVESVTVQHMPRFLKKDGEDASVFVVVKNNKLGSLVSNHQTGETTFNAFADNVQFEYQGGVDGNTKTVVSNHQDAADELKKYLGAPCARGLTHLVEGVEEHVARKNVAVQGQPVEWADDIADATFTGAKVARTTEAKSVEDIARAEFQKKDLPADEVVYNARLLIGKKTSTVLSGGALLGLAAAGYGAFKFFDKTYNEDPDADNEVDQG